MLVECGTLVECGMRNLVECFLWNEECRMLDVECRMVIVGNRMFIYVNLWNVSTM
jgi:hypothetical protein